MLGMLLSVLKKVKPLLPNFTIEESGSVHFKRSKYRMGFVPSYVGEVDEQLAVINIADVDDGFVIVVVAANAACRTISLTVTNSGHVTNQGFEYEWRFDDAAADLAQYLKDLAAGSENSMGKLNRDAGCSES